MTEFFIIILPCQSIISQVFQNAFPGLKLKITRLAKQKATSNFYNFYFYLMTSKNYDRMIRLAEEVFAVKSDPSQLDVNLDIIERLKRMHSATISEHVDENGPVAWVLLIPTTLELMNLFLEKKISEKELYNLTPLNIKYEALYLCSALVLEEYRRKGITKRLVLAAIENIRKDHPLKSLFVWTFSKEGELASESIARLSGLPLQKRLD